MPLPSPSRALLLGAAAIVSAGCAGSREADGPSLDYHYSRVGFLSDQPSAVTFDRLDALAPAANIQLVSDSSSELRRVYRSAEGDLVVTLTPSSTGALGEVELRERRDYERAAWNRWRQAARARYGDAFLQWRSIPLWRSAAPNACTSEVSATESTPGLVMAERISGMNPAYPREMRRAGVESRVLVQVFLNREGRVVCLNGLVVSTPQATANVVGAVLSWEFRPFKVNDVPVQAPATIPVRFRLD